MVKEGRKYILEPQKYILMPKAWQCKRQCLNKAQTIPREVLEYLLKEGALLTELSQPSAVPPVLKKENLTVSSRLWYGLFAYESTAQGCSCKMKPSLHTISWLSWELTLQQNGWGGEFWVCLSCNCLDLSVLESFFKMPRAACKPRACTLHLLPGAVKKQTVAGPQDKSNWILKAIFISVLWMKAVQSSFSFDKLKEKRILLLEGN